MKYLVKNSLTYHPSFATKYLVQNNYRNSCETKPF